MVHRARTTRPILHEEPDEKTWVWSDLHLGHDFSISAFNRPFRSPQAADKAMHRAWIERAAEYDTTICLGDVTVDGCLQPHHVMRWRQAPGSKVLVLGNHDVDPINRVKLLDIQRTTLALAAPGDPPLLLTHVPLIQVPHGAINVHGHIHDKPAPTPNRPHQRERRAARLRPREPEGHPASRPQTAGRAERARLGAHQGPDRHRQRHDAVTHFRFLPRIRGQTRKHEDPLSW